MELTRARSRGVAYAIATPLEDNSEGPPSIRQTRLRPIPVSLALD